MLNISQVSLITVLETVATLSKLFHCKDIMTLMAPFKIQLISWMEETFNHHSLQLKKLLEYLLQMGFVLNSVGDIQQLTT